jgi:hypothetical protein
MDRNWAMTPFLDGAKILQPALFIASQKDPVIEFLGEEFQALERNVPNLRKKALLSRAGHWTQQERPGDVNRLLIEFLERAHPLARALSQFAISEDRRGAGFSLVASRLVSTLGFELRPLHQQASR